MHKFETVKLTSSCPQQLFLSAVLCFSYLSENIILPGKLECNFHQICLTTTIVTIHVTNMQCASQERVSCEAVHYQHTATTHLLRMQ